MDVNHTPVFRSLWEGSMVGKADPQLVFLFLLGHADADDCVDIHPSAIAALTGLPIERVWEALKYLEAPDEMSRSPDSDGRRITRLEDHREWGWHMVNRKHYKNLYKKEMHRRADRDYQARKRRSASSTVGSPSSTVDPPSVHAIGNRQDELEPKHSSASRTERDPDGFSDFWGHYPKRVGRRAAAKAFESASKRHPQLEPADFSNAAKWYAENLNGTEERFIPHPTTWLNQDRFLEEFGDAVETPAEPEPGDC